MKENEVKPREPFCTGCAIGVSVVLVLAAIGIAHILASIAEAMSK